MEEKELWMNKLKEKLGDYTEPLPASGWEQLEKELMPPVERKIYPYRKWTVAAAPRAIWFKVSSMIQKWPSSQADRYMHLHKPGVKKG